MTCKFTVDATQKFDGDNPGYGEWIIIGSCETKICMLPEKPVNGFVQGIGSMDIRAIQHGNAVHFECDQGYTLYKNSEIATSTELACDLTNSENICVDDNLENPFTCIESNCKNFSNSVHGSIEILKTEMVHGETLDFPCDEYHCGKVTGFCSLGLLITVGECKTNFCAVSENLGNGVVVADFVPGFALENGQAVEVKCAKSGEEMFRIGNLTSDEVICDARGEVCFKENGLENPFECK